MPGWGEAAVVKATFFFFFFIGRKQLTLKAASAGKGEIREARSLCPMKHRATYGHPIHIKLIGSFSEVSPWLSTETPKSLVSSVYSTIPE